MDIEFFREGILSNFKTDFFQNLYIAIHKINRTYGDDPEATKMILKEMKNVMNEMEDAIKWTQEKLDILLTEEEGG